MKTYKCTFGEKPELKTFFVHVTPSTDTLALVIAWNRLVAKYGETYARHRAAEGVRINRVR